MLKGKPSADQLRDSADLGQLQNPWMYQRPRNYEAIVVVVVAIYVAAAMGMR